MFKEILYDPTSSIYMLIPFAILQITKHIIFNNLTNVNAFPSEAALCWLGLHYCTVT